MPVASRMARSAHEVRAVAAAVELHANRLLGDPRALEHLGKCGVARELLVQQRIGFAAGDELVPHLVWRNVPTSAARRVGLLRADGRERLAGRIVFAELRQRQPVWLVGRLLEPASLSWAAWAQGAPELGSGQSQPSRPRAAGRPYCGIVFTIPTAVQMRVTLQGDRATRLAAPDRAAHVPLR